MQSKDQAPAHLSAAAAAEWYRLRELLLERDQWVSTTAGLVEAYCAAYGRFVKAELEIQKNAEVIKIPGSDTPTHNPWLAVTERAQNQMRQIATTLQLGREPDDGSLPDDKGLSRPVSAYFPTATPSRRGRRH